MRKSRHNYTDPHKKARPLCPFEDYVLEHCCRNRRERRAVLANAFKEATRHNRPPPLPPPRRVQLRPARRFTANGEEADHAQR